MKKKMGKHNQSILLFSAAIETKPIDDALKLIEAAIKNVQIKLN